MAIISKPMRGLLVAASMGLFAPPGMAAGLLNGSFEGGPLDNSFDPNAGPFTRGVVPDGWSALPGFEAPDIQGPSYNQVGAGFAQLLHAQDGQRFLDMNGAGPQGGMFQDVAGLVAGETATLSFWSAMWAQNSSGTLVAKLIDASNGTVLNTVTLTYDYSPNATQSSWTQSVLTALVPVSGILRVQFEGNSDSNARGAPGLDNVVLTASSGAVPEPASWVLMIGGFGLAGLAMRTRGQRSAVSA